MKLISENKAAERLKERKEEFARAIREGYEYRAKSCAACETPGACCLDAHFVNVHITRLEAVVIRKALERLPAVKQVAVYERVDQCISDYNLSADGDSFAKTYACPLFEPGTGCLVHNEGKPLPCIHHACYENREDLPPDELLAEQEEAVENLNLRAYGEKERWLPLPVAITRSPRQSF